MRKTSNCKANNDETANVPFHKDNSNKLPENQQQRDKMNQNIGASSCCCDDDSESEVRMPLPTTDPVRIESGKILLNHRANVSVSDKHSAEPLSEIQLDVERPPPRSSNCQNQQQNGDRSPVQITRSRNRFQKNQSTSITSLSSASQCQRGNVVVAHRENKAVHILRAVMLLLLLLTATVVSIGVYRFTRQQEVYQFETEYRYNALRLMDIFQNAVRRRLSAINALSTAITSHAIATNQTFPMVTVPDFALRGSDLRSQTGATVIHFMPVVWDKNRLDWEEYSLQHRNHIDEAYNTDTAYWKWQDERFGIAANNYTYESTKSKNAPPSAPDEKPILSKQQAPASMTILDDGSGFHPRIWNMGLFETPRGDEPEGNGPYLPLWQRSPINDSKQKPLNLNFADTAVFRGVLPKLLETKQAIMNFAQAPPTEIGRREHATNLAISQFRNDIDDFIDDPFTFLAYPVFDSFDLETKEIGGVLTANMHWKLLFEGTLPFNAHGYICILENSYNQTLTYRIDGGRATFIGEDDPHDPEFEYLEESASINDFMLSQSGPRTRSYTSVCLSQSYGKYTLRIYPSRETRESFETNDPVLFSILVLSVFVFTSIVFITFAFVVERRQNIVMATAVANAEMVATKERELNEFLSHEVRNPLAAAISACSLVKASLLHGGDSIRITDQQVKKSITDDINVIDSSLSFVNDFLRSMLDMHRATVEEVDFAMTPTNIRQDVLEPVCKMLKQRYFQFSVYCECPENLVVMTYPLCLKQILLHLGVPATNSVSGGFVRFHAAVVNGMVQLSIEDSGPGIPLDVRPKLFETPANGMYDMCEGTVFARSGLAFSKRLVNLLHGNLCLDESYNSGVAVDSPGTRFVIRLNQPPMDSVSQRSNFSDAKSMDQETLVGSSIGGELPTRPSLPDNLRVLIVDDDVILRKLFARSIQRAAPTWTIEQAESGESAIRLITDMTAEDDRNKFAIIFMDQYMQNSAACCDQMAKTGTETVEILRAEGVQTTRICGLSANDMEQSFLSAGADFFKLKPVPAHTDDMKQWLLYILEVVR